LPNLYSLANIKLPDALSQSYQYYKGTKYTPPPDSHSERERKITGKKKKEKKKERDRKERRRNS
jgi:hypothetical protein